MFYFGLLIKDVYYRQEQTSAIMHYLLKNVLDIGQVLTFSEHLNTLNVRKSLPATLSLMPAYKESTPHRRPA